MDTDLGESKTVQLLVYLYEQLVWLPQRLPRGSRSAGGNDRM